MAGTSGARVVRAVRNQTSFDLMDLEAWLAEDHLARSVVDFVEGLDLSAFYAEIASREGGAGRPALDPAVLLALWLYATIEGVGSARALVRLSESDLAYRWLRGGMDLNHHTLSDFRVRHVDLLDELLSRSLACLDEEGLIRLDDVLIDGTKVKASASRDSFRTGEGLEKAERAARQHIEALKAEIGGDPGAGLRRRQAARDRAARERLERVEKAKAQLERIEAERQSRGNRDGGRKAAEPKASTSDPQARSMRFSDGSHGPGYNVQIAATPDHGFILGICTTDRRNDLDLVQPMIGEIERRLGRRPKAAIADQGYVSTDDIVALAACEPPVRLYVPLPEERTDIKPQSVRRRAKRQEKEPEAIKQWRQRMVTDEAEAKMKKRKRIELTNAHVKAAGLACQLLRGLVKVQAAAILVALAHNLRTALRVRRTLKAQPA